MNSRYAPWIESKAFMNCTRSVRCGLDLCRVIPRSLTVGASRIARCLHLRGRWQGSALTEGVLFRILPQSSPMPAPSRKEPVGSKIHQRCVKWHLRVVVVRVWREIHKSPPTIPQPAVSRFHLACKISSRSDFIHHRWISLKNRPIKACFFLPRLDAK